MENKVISFFKAAQAVHGYRDGHRLLSSSIVLDELSTIEMARMSDLMPKRLASDEFYFCGYPLKSINKYVVACTWPAPEMPRPGCVWTHSLIIDYATVAKIVSAQCLLKYFRRPNAYEVTAYAEDVLVADTYPAELSVDNSAGCSLQPCDVATLKVALHEIYFSKNNRIVLPCPLGAHSACLAPFLVWNQMPPRLRRDFVFCTSASARSLTPSSLVTLLLSDEVLDQHMPNVDGPEIGLQTLLKDALVPEKTSLRSFIWRYVTDINEARAGVAKLAIVGVELFKNPAALALRNVSLNVVDLLKHPAEARLLKKELLGGALLGEKAFGEEVKFELIVENVLPFFCHLPAPYDDDEAIDIFLSKHLFNAPNADLSGRIVWLLEVCWDSTIGSFGRKFVLELISRSPARLIASLKLRPEVKLTLASLEPALLSMNEFWNSFECEPNFKDWELLNKLGSLELIVTGLLTGRMYAPVRALLKKYRNELFPALVKFWLASDYDIQHELLLAFRAERTELIRYLSSASEIELRILPSLSRDIFYAPYPHIEAEEWVRLLSHDKARNLIDPFLAFVLFNQAGSTKNHNSIELYKLSFPALHDVEHNAGPDALPVVERIYQAFPKDYNSRHTDAPSRVRRKLCEFFQNGKDYYDFIHCAKTDETLGMLFETMAGLWGGPHWLEDLAAASRSGLIQLSLNQQLLLQISAAQEKKTLFNFWTL